MSKRQVADVPVADTAPSMIEAVDSDESDEDDDTSRHATEYFVPNDGRQQESLDFAHHYLTKLLDDKLFLAPIQEDAEGLTVLDVGTGTGIWCIDFGCEHPEAEVIGTDLSPIQPAWVPANVRFEIEDAGTDWTFRDNNFDFIHMRYLLGGITDWAALFRQAYRCCKPGGWIESIEVDTTLYSDDGSVENNPTIAIWNRLFKGAAEKMGKSFNVVAEDLQRRSIEEAGVTDYKVVNLKVPMGGWPRDPKLAELGRISLLSLETDVEGFTMLLWYNVLQWPQDEYRPFLDAFRKALRDRRTHAYLKLRFVYGRKPEAA
ncbi:mRNA 3'-end-processing protein YTH1 [Madurella fahalii]|uniref:mRNA 3'-end-processing protein YTH1 n=1 Tax=Madurella fahalii TaxID=1157608 RepID=A0ABQ0GTG5_9PEZI